MATMNARSRLSEQEADHRTSMLNRYARAFFNHVMTPIARGLVRLGVSPDIVTLLGTLGVCVGALAFYTRGEFFIGTLIMTPFTFSDMIDGTMARLSGRASRWGAFLDSTLDRIADAAIFGGLVVWFAGQGDDLPRAGLALYCLAIGAAVSYSKARAESLGFTADVGIAERPERVLVALVVTGLDGLGVPYVLAIGLWAIAIASTVTLGQRMFVVRRQAVAAAASSRSAS